MSDYMKTRRGEESDSFFCRFTFGQFFAILILEVFTLFFVFYLGARYGREFLGLDKIALAAVAQPNSPADAGSDVLTTTDPKATELARELVSKAQTPELKDRIAKMFEDARGVPAENVEPTLPQVPLTASEPPTPVQAATESAVQPPPAEPVSQPVTTESDMGTSVVKVKSVESARYSVQVGSYPKMDEATRAIEKWKTKGYPAYVMIANIPDRGQWYRIRIGGFGSRDEAQEYLNEFKTKENAEGLVVMNEQ